MISRYFFAKAGVCIDLLTFLSIVSSDSHPDQLMIKYSCYTEEGMEDKTINYFAEERKEFDQTLKLLEPRSKQYLSDLRLIAERINSGTKTKTPSMLLFQVSFTLPGCLNKKGLTYLNVDVGHVSELDALNKLKASLNEKEVILLETELHELPTFLCSQTYLESKMFLGQIAL